MPAQSRHPRLRPVRRERGQALIYGLFVLTSALAMLFFLFNTGQLASEKTKLVNTADAVAYSAGIMHARALNFDAYTNRALIANEVMIAQLVSMQSWLTYTATHSDNVIPLNCLSPAARPILWGLVRYELACAPLSFDFINALLHILDATFQPFASVITGATEAAKAVLQSSQAAMPVLLLDARNRVMQEVANANYAGDGSVKVDPIPLTDDFYLFDGAPLIHRYEDDERKRLKPVVRMAAYKDRSIETRRWDSSTPWPCLLAPSATFKRRGGTDMIGLDEWMAVDTSSLHPRHFSLSIFSFGCRGDAEIALGYAVQTATSTDDGDNGANFGGSGDNGDARASASSNNFGGYTGLPRFFDLRQAALDYGPGNTDVNKNALHVMFSVRVVRAKAQANTSAGRSAIKPSGAFALFQGSEVGAMSAAVATADVFFERADHFSGGRKELASLFNPYWQVRLGATSAAALADAVARPAP